MTKWTECRIGDEVGVAQGLCMNSKSKHLLAETGYPLLRITDLINKTAEQFINENKVSKKFISKSDDLIYTRTGQVGLIFKGRVGVVHNNCFRVLPSEKINKHYLYWFLKTNYAYDFANSVATGAAQPDLGHDSFKSMPFRYPTIRNQKKIAAILSAYDDLIENNQRRIALLEKMAEEIYREWFVRLCFPGYENTKFTKGVPEGWSAGPLSSIVSEIRKSVKKKNLSDDENYIGLEHIPRKSISISEWGTADSIDSDKLLFQKGDILFSKIRPYLHKVALSHISGACSTDTIVLRPKSKEYEGYFLFTVFSETFIELATVASKGTKMPRADWDFLKKLELVTPNKQLLEAYQKHFETFFSQIVNLLGENKALATSRNLLLPRLMSGKLSVENLDIQFPPSILEESVSLNT